MYRNQKFFVAPVIKEGEDCEDDDEKNKDEKGDEDKVWSKKDSQDSIRKPMEIRMCH